MPRPEDKVEVSGRLSSTFALILGGIAYQVAFTNLAIVLPLVSSTLHLGGAGKGLAVGAFPLGASAIFIPAGILAARVGARPTLLLGLVIQGTAGAVSALSQNLVELTLLRVATGAGAALFYAPAVGVLAAMYPTPQRALVIGLFASLSIAVGATVGFLTGAYLGLAFGWRSVLVLGGLGTLGVATFCLVSVPSQVLAPARRDLADWKSRALQVLRSPSMWCLTFGVSGLTTAAFLAPAFLSAFVLSAHADWGLGYAGLVGAAAFVATVPGALVGSRWSEHGYDRRKILGLFAVAFGLLFLLIPIADRLQLALLFATLGFFFGAAIAIYLTMPSYLPATSGERTPLAIGMLESGQGFLRFGGAILFGSFEVLAGFAWAWWVSGLVALGTLPFLLGVPSNRRAGGIAPVVDA